MKIGLYRKGTKINLENDIAQIKELVFSFGDEFIDISFSKEKVDVILVLGGDGTILQAAMVALEMDSPMLCVSRGYLGFLAEVDIHGLNEALAKLKRNEYFYDDRNLLSVKCDKKEYLCLNEVVVKGDAFKLVNLDVYLNDNFLSSYKTDGVIISSSTGSTAYNLSAGGPIIFPDTEAIIITPVCSHSLTIRPLVVSAKDKIKVVSTDTNCAFSVDGNEAVIAEKLDLQVEVSKNMVRFIRFDKYSFIKGLRSKLNWSGKFKSSNDKES
ncbi:MAG: NAD(+)/NADH kinase [Candidatus Riflemargulisbacteria bacterium]